MKGRNFKLKKLSGEKKLKNFFTANMFLKELLVQRYRVGFPTRSLRFRNQLRKIFINPENR